jgi:putative endonuclease
LLRRKGANARPGGGFRVPDAVQRSLRCSAEPGPTRLALRLKVAKLGPDQRFATSLAQRAVPPRGHKTQLDALFFVYILASKRNGTLYIGVTNNLARRISEHKAKLVPGFTRKYRVDQRVYFEGFDSILEARAREQTLKRWRHAWKIALIEKSNPEWRDISDELNS